MVRRYWTMKGSWSARSFLASAMLLALAAACGGSTSDSKSGSGGGPNAGGAAGKTMGGAGGTASGGTSGAGAIGQIGDSCQDSSQCPSSSFAAGVCMKDAPDGYCTIVIAECPAGGGVSACPPGATCVNGFKFAGQVGDFCLKDCNSGDECRPGYTCCPWQGGPSGVCSTGPACP